MAINWSARELEVFVAVAESLNYRRAAELTFLSQPAVSGIVSRLERSLGARLFDRSTRSVRLTAAGATLLAHARLLGKQFDAAERSVRDLVELRGGRVRVAALPSLAATAVPAAFARFRSIHPQVDLAVLDTLSVPAFDLVRAGEVDFALTAANPAYADLEYTPLAGDRFVLVVGARHPSACADRPIMWAEAACFEHISMPAPTSVRQYVEEAFLRLGRRFEPRFEVEHLATITAMVAAGLGVAALPELAAHVTRDRQVRHRRLVEPELIRPIGLVTRRGVSLSVAAAAMVETMREEVLSRLQPPVSKAAARGARAAASRG